MQIQKSDTRNTILKAAKQEFARQGFQNASMRKIASVAGIRVGNIYNYFDGKDDLFRAVVTPAIEALDSLFLDTDYLSEGEASLSSEVAESRTRIFHKCRVAMKILLFGAQGSKLENFKSDYTNRITDIVKARVEEPVSEAPASDFSIHLLCVWHFTLIEEMLMHDVKASEIKSIFSDWENVKRRLNAFKRQNRPQ